MVNISQRLSQTLKQSPQQVLLSSLLQLPVLMLEQKIKMELETNPLLEQVDEMDLEQEQLEEEEQDMELELKEEDKNGELKEEKDDEVEAVEKDDIDWEAIVGDEENYEYRAPRDDSAEQFERPEVAKETLQENLLNQLHMQKLDEEQVMIGEYIIWNINEDGYLSCSVDLIAQNLGVGAEEVEKVLKVIQHFEPVGIAARHLQECLLIQLEEKEPCHELALAIIRDDFDDFKNKRYEKIAKKLNITLEQIKQAIEEITHLNPKPGEGYFSYHENVVIPDITVERDGEEFNIFLNDSNIPHLRINNRYKNILLQKAGSQQRNKEAKEFVKKRLESARWLINSIHQRRLTILKVMETIIQKQRAFFENGKEFIKPMILKNIADEIGMDISTVSRVTNGKYVQTEHGVFELKYFFSEAIKSDDGEDVSNRMIKDLIKKMIEEEDKQDPLNDQTIAAKLKEQGYNVARRTVAKYREQMNIPVSRLRKEI